MKRGLSFEKGTVIGKGGCHWKRGLSLEEGLQFSSMYCTVATKNQCRVLETNDYVPPLYFKCVCEKVRISGRMH